MKRIFGSLFAMIAAVFGLFDDCNGAVCNGYQISLEAELPVIKKAARRNGIEPGSDDFALLLAIRKAENGRAGCEFGVTHPRAWDTDLDTQAGWSAATITKHHKRFRSAEVSAAFINSLGNRYCPAANDPDGNKNWKRNVKFWFAKFEEVQNADTSEKDAG